MPTYQYACTNPECGERFDLVQSFIEATATECPVCGKGVRKVFSAVGVVFKGSGFYRNDSRVGSGKESVGESNGDKASAEKSGGEKSSEKSSSSSASSDSSSSKDSSSSSESSNGSSSSRSSSSSNGSSGSSSSGSSSGKAAAPA